MLTLHHLENSRSQRVLWLLEELGLEYRIRRYQRDPKTSLAPASLRKVHRLGKSPVLTDGERSIAESAVILEYLARTHGSPDWAPAPDHPRYWEFSYWLHYAEGSLMPPLLLRLVFDRLRTGPAPFFVRPILKRIADEVDKAFISDQLRTHFSWVDKALKGREWLVGDQPTIADVQMSFPLEAALARGTLGEDYRHIRAYIERFQARPAYRRALAAGGDYDYGPQA